MWDNAVQRIPRTAPLDMNRITRDFERDWDRTPCVSVCQKYVASACVCWQTTFKRMPSKLTSLHQDNHLTIIQPIRVHMPTCGHLNAVQSVPNYSTMSPVRGGWTRRHEKRSRTAGRKCTHTHTKEVVSFPTIHQCHTRGVCPQQFHHMRLPWSHSIQWELLIYTKCG